MAIWVSLSINERSTVVGFGRSTNKQCFVGSSFLNGSKLKDEGGRCCDGKCALDQGVRRENAAKHRGLVDQNAVLTNHGLWPHSGIGEKYWDNEGKPRLRHIFGLKDLCHKNYTIFCNYDILSAKWDFYSPNIQSKLQLLFVYYFCFHFYRLAQPLKKKHRFHEKKIESVNINTAIRNLYDHNIFWYSGFRF